MNDVGEWMGVALIFAIPFLLGIGALVAAFSLFPKQVAGDPNPPSTSRKVLAVALGCGGTVMLSVALGFAACFGMAAMS